MLVIWKEFLRSVTTIVNQM